MLGIANGSNVVERGIALVVLSARMSASVAQNLIVHQIPAVVGMAFSVRVEAAKKFADLFYLALSQEKSLAQAMNWGREAMGFKSNQWYRPSLYLRWKDNEGGKMFAINAKRNQSSQDSDKNTNHVPAKAPDPLQTPASTVQRASRSPGSKATELKKAYHYDAFISYSHKDHDWVYNVLLSRLKKEGLSVCIDDLDFEIGAPSMVNMENAVDLSRKTLLILTPNWIASEWTRFESLILQTQDPTNLERRLLPIMVQHCTLDKRLNIFTYLDLTRPAEFDFQMQRLLSAIRSSPGELKPTQPPDTSDFIAQAVEYYRDIETNRSLLTEVSELFLEKDIWPAQCRRANNSLQRLSNDVQPFLDLLDSAAELTETDDKLRASLLIPLNLCKDLLLELRSLISVFSTICQPPSRESMIRQREIQNKLQELEESLNKIRTRMTPFDKSANDKSVPVARPKTGSANSRSKRPSTRTPPTAENDSGKLFEMRSIQFLCSLNSIEQKLMIWCILKVQMEFVIN